MIDAACVAGTCSTTSPGPFSPPVSSRSTSPSDEEPVRRDCQAITLSGFVLAALVGDGELGEFQAALYFPLPNIPGVALGPWPVTATKTVPFEVVFVEFAADFPVELIDFRIE